MSLRFCPSNWMIGDCDCRTWPKIFLYIIQCIIVLITKKKERRKEERERKKKRTKKKKEKKKEKIKKERKKKEKKRSELKLNYVFRIRLVSLAPL